MAKFYVTALMYANATIDVEADSAEEAAEQAAAHSLCHQCSRHVELGDPYATTVTTEDGDEVYNDTSPMLDCATDEELAAEVAKRKKAKKRAKGGR